MIPNKYKKYNPEYLTKGKRGIIYKFTKNKKQYVIKIKRKESKAIDRIENEAKILKIINKYNIAPTIKDSGKDYLVMEYIKGKQIKEYLEKIKNPNKILKTILKQCFILDKLKINKLEMHKPTKHIICYKNKATLIDFERTYTTKKPKNVTQFCEFINRLNKLNKKIKKIPIIKIKQYKKHQTKENFNLLFS